MSKRIVSRRVDFDKYRAPRILKIVQERLLNGNLIKKPLWFDAVSMFPPIHRPVAVLHNDASRFTATLSQSKQDQDRLHENADKYCQKMPSRKWSSIKHWKTDRDWRKAVVDASRLFAFPQEIEFPEDRLRERFYRDHPIERSRPRIFKEEQSPMSLSPDDSLDEPAPGSIRTGEDVAQYQQHLMNRSENALSEDEAYRLACQKFYESRVREEQQLQELRLKAQQLDASTASEPVENQGNVSENVPLDEHEPDLQGHAVRQEKLSQGGNAATDLLFEQWLELEQAAVDQAVEIKYHHHLFSD